MLLESELIQFIILLFAGIVCVKIYTRAEERKAASDAELAKEKAQIYADARVRSAKIEADVDKYGFNLENSQTDIPDTGNESINQIMQFVATPEGQAMAQKFLGGKK